MIPAAITPASRRITALSPRIRPLSRGITQLSRRIRPLSRRIRPLSSGISPLSHGIRPLSRRIRPLSRRIRPLSRRITAPARGRNRNLPGLLKVNDRGTNRETPPIASFERRRRQTPRQSPSALCPNTACCPLIIKPPGSAAPKGKPASRAYHWFLPQKVHGEGLRPP